MLRNLWTVGSLVPFSHGSKVPSEAIFASRVITKKVYSINFLPLAVSKLFPWSYHICKKYIDTSCLLFAKTKKTQVPKFYFLPSKSKLGHKNWFSIYKSSKTHTCDKKAFSISLPKPQEHTLSRWREKACGHWAHPGQRSHISPTAGLAETTLLLLNYKTTYNTSVRRGALCNAPLRP